MREALLCPRDFVGAKQIEFHYTFGYQLFTPLLPAQELYATLNDGLFAYMPDRRLAADILHCILLAIPPDAYSETAFLSDRHTDGDLFLIFHYFAIQGIVILHIFAQSNNYGRHNSLCRKQRNDKIL